MYTHLCLCWFMFVYLCVNSFMSVYTGRYLQAAPPELRAQRGNDHPHASYWSLRGWHAHWVWCHHADSSSFQEGNDTRICIRFQHTPQVSCFSTPQLQSLPRPSSSTSPRNLECFSSAQLHPRPLLYTFCRTRYIYVYNLIQHCIHVYNRSILQISVCPVLHVVVDRTATDWKTAGRLDRVHAAVDSFGRRAKQRYANVSMKNPTGGRWYCQVQLNLCSHTHLHSFCVLTGAASPWGEMFSITRNFVRPKRPS